MLSSKLKERGEIMRKEEKAEFYYLVNEIIKHQEFQKRKEYLHHEDNLYNHCYQVAKITFLISRKLKLDYKKATIGALLHDFYYEDWQKNKKRKSFLKLHGFVHAKEAKENAQYYFPSYVDKKVSNIIERHMFPLTLKPPLYLESWLVCFVDKCVSITIFKNPRKLPKYIGLKELKKNGKNNSRRCHRSWHRRD